jgi:hypothetical protein
MTNMDKQLFDQFIRRFSYGKSIKKLDSQGLHAGSPHYCYCSHCGVPTEAFPEKPFVDTNNICSQCSFLESKQLLEEAKNIAEKFFKKGG